MNGIVSMAFNRNCFPKMTDFSRLGALRAVTYTLKVVVSKKWREIDTLLLHITNRKYHMAYLFVPFPMNLDDLESYSPNAGLIKCNSTNILFLFGRWRRRRRRRRNDLRHNRSSRRGCLGGCHRSGHLLYSMDQPAVVRPGIPASTEAIDVKKTMEKKIKNLKK